MGSRVRLPNLRGCFLWPISSIETLPPVGSFTFQNSISNWDQMFRHESLWRNVIFKHQQTSNPYHDRQRPLKFCPTSLCAFLTMWQSTGLFSQVHRAHFHFRALALVICSAWDLGIAVSCFRFQLQCRGCSFWSSLQTSHKSSKRRLFCLLTFPRGCIDPASFCITEPPLELLLCFVLCTQDNAWCLVVAHPVFKLSTTWRDFVTQTRKNGVMYVNAYILVTPKWGTRQSYRAFQSGRDSTSEKSTYSVSMRIWV